MNLLPCDPNAPQYFSARLIALMLSSALRTLVALSCLVAAPTLAQNVTEFSAGMPAVGKPTNIITGPDGNLWFAQQGSIGRITPAGVIKMFAVGGDIQGITAGPDGNVWFTEFSSNRIGRITQGEVVTLFSIGGRGLWGITTGPDGNIWFTMGGGIGRITPAGVVTEFSAGISAGADPYRITSGPDGNLWFTEAYGNRIGRITPAGVIVEFSAGISANALLYAITSGRDGNLWFTGYSPDRIGRITPAGVITEFTAGMSANAGPRDITSGPDGNLWFTEAWTGKIGRITPAGVITEFSAGTALVQPNDAGGTTVIGHSGITAGPDENLWFTEAVNRIGRFTIDGFGQGAVMSLSATALTFASQLVGTTSTVQSVTLSNTDNTPLNIASVVASGDYALTHNCGTGLGVSAFCTLSITFTPTTIGTRIGTVTITGDAINSPRAIQLTGVGQGAVAFLSATALTFASQGVGSTSAAQSITLTNTGVAALNISSIVASGDFAQTDNCGTTVAAGASCAINVTFTPTAAGTRSGNLTITDDALGSPRTISLSGAGTPTPVVTLNPGAVLFAPRSIGTTSAAKTVALSNTGGATLNLSNIQASGDFAQSNNCGAGLGVGGSCSINVTFTPTVAGSRTGSVSIASDAPGSPHLVWLSDGALPYAVDVRSYIPAALSNAGYMGFLRVINTGKSATPVTVAVIDQNTGAVGTAGTLTSALPAGAAVTYAATDIERALGAPIDAESRPRIRVSALAGVQVQSFQSNPSGVVTLNAGAQSGTSVDVPSYLPWALHSSGYASYLRFVNIGSSASAVGVALIDGDVGAVRAAGMLNAALPPGAAITYSGQQIEAALGISPPASARPRIRVTSTAPVDVQSFQSNPGGVVTETATCKARPLRHPTRWIYAATFPRRWAAVATWVLSE